MRATLDFMKVRTSWTKYDIVRVMEIVYDVDTIRKAIQGVIKIDKPILKSFLGMRTLESPIPKYWYQIQYFPLEKDLFALLCVIFTHGSVVSEFAEMYSTQNMKGKFRIKNGKRYTNIRSALVESGAAKPFHRKSEVVPYDLRPILSNHHVGPIFKNVLIERISRIVDTENMTSSEFYDICFENMFHKALSLSKSKFRSWIEGQKNDTPYKVVDSSISKVSANGFLNVADFELNFENCKEIYLLGENGDGKTLILYAIFLAFNSNYIELETSRAEAGSAIDILKTINRSALVGYDQQGNEYDVNEEIKLKNIYAYGTSRNRIDTDNHEKYGFMSLFDNNQMLINPITWLERSYYNEMYLKSELDNDSYSNRFETIADIIHSILEKNVQIKFEQGNVVFYEKGHIVKFDHLSEGYSSVIIFLCDLMYRLSLQKSKIPLEHNKCVVLVDEIGLHLHPRWQLKLPSKLRKFFPNTQFIFTTHSPMIIHGASADALLFRVYRETNTGITQISTPYRRMQLDHLMINSLLTSPIFGVTDISLGTIDQVNSHDSYLQVRVSQKLNERLSSIKDTRESYIDESTIDMIIDDIIKSELSDD